MPAIYSSDCLGDVSPGQAPRAQLGFLTGDVQARGRRDAVTAVEGPRALPGEVGLLYTSSRTLSGAPADPVEELPRSVGAEGALGQAAQTHAPSPALLPGTAPHQCRQAGSIASDANRHSVGKLKLVFCCVFPSTMANEITLCF